MTRLAYVITSPLSARTLLRGQLGYMQRRGFDVTLIADDSEGDLDAIGRAEGVRVVAVPMRRSIEPLADLRSLVRLYRALREAKPDLVNAGTMKAGLLGMMAAFAARVPVRVYVLRGLRLEGTKGLVRAILLACEVVSSGCAHRVLCVSRSLEREYERLHVARRDKLTVLADGSSNGVDAARFEPTEERRGAAARIRAELGIPASAKVIGFVGRLTKDKGASDLLRAFERVAERAPAAHLVLVGGFDETDPVAGDARAAIAANPNIHCTDFVRDTSIYYPIMSALCLPTAREGFPNVPLEAAIAGVPTVAYRATGTVDAVVDGETGKIVEQADWRGLADALLVYVEDDEVRAAHGARARDRALRSFASEAVWSALEAEYRRLLGIST